MKKKSSIITWIISIIALLFIAYRIILSVKTGQHVPMPLIGCILLVIIGISRIISARNQHQGSEEDQKKFNKIVIRSVILAPIILAIFLTVVVLIKLKMG